jgi:hypothetical protein
VAGVTGMPPVCLPCRQFALSRCRVRQKIVPALPPLPWRKSRKRDPICYRFFGKFFCAVAVR